MQATPGRTEYKRMSTRENTDAGALILIFYIDDEAQSHFADGSVEGDLSLDSARPATYSF